MTDTTTRTATLLALADRVEAGESGDIIERQIAPHLGWTWHGGIMTFWADPSGKMAPLPRWTRSLDAIEALRVKVLPKSVWVKISQTMPNNRWVAILRLDERIDPFADDRYGHADVEHRARLAALLRAIAASEETDRG